MPAVFLLNHGRQRAADSEDSSHLAGQDRGKLRHTWGHTGFTGGCTAVVIKHSTERTSQRHFYRCTYSSQPRTKKKIARATTTTNRETNSHPKKWSSSQTQLENKPRAIDRSIDRPKFELTEHSEVGDREGSPRVFVRLELLGLGLSD